MYSLGKMVIDKDGSRSYAHNFPVSSETVVDVFDIVAEFVSMFEICVGRGGKSATLQHSRAASRSMF